MRHQEAPHPGANSKRIALVADIAVIQPVRALPGGSFIVLGLVVGQAPPASRLQKNQLAASLPSCCCSARAVTSYSYLRTACYCCYAGDIAGAVPAFVNPFKSMG
ncbi:hypothetical protein DN824_05195 [Stutzerimonas nosocomialis]|uniref:Uncharacterized protein n=1 Tax=Stutzerimonas nosocomialis TaxID=1056496 RepID=A0A5R9QKC9_9GAMM|nr:hypothetical protein DN826_08580 [Stutzerimonas nosocomialis]TLX60263.1 hypothetical protein DN824_05195 [Stutzerimonas nosocomialis]TLX65422.1 hypothetical protein DN820_00680 [Stutzerimonas nosocomialis]